MSAANPVQQALLPVGGPPSESGTENSVSSSLPLSPMLATSIADESGSDRVIMLDEIVVKQRLGQLWWRETAVVVVHVCSDLFPEMEIDGINSHGGGGGFPEGSGKKKWKLRHQSKPSISIHTQELCRRKTIDDDFMAILWEKEEATFEFGIAMNGVYILPTISKNQGLLYSWQAGHKPVERLQVILPKPKPDACPDSNT
ncbi:hypothetical protein B0H14DRAFT_3137403 [Mycena olivaceomarginata]|nr:hypothetical protein B0H14DRAFT_3137403 [Mycena olivaceomarginata]